MLYLHQIGFERNGQVLFKNLELGLNPGELLHISGRNGSGKTTLLKILCGLLRPTQGKVHWQGQPIVSCRADYHADLHYLGHLAGIKDGLTCRENLEWAAASRSGKIDKISAALETLHVRNVEQVRVHHLSAGQKRRVLFAKLLICPARLWILDEPFAALDGDGVNCVESLLNTHLQQGGLIVLTSHQFFTSVGVTQQIEL